MELFFLKSLLNLSQYCFCFLFWFFGHQACGILAPQPRIKHVPTALEGGVLTTGPPGEYLFVLYLPIPCQSTTLSTITPAKVAKWECGPSVTRPSSLLDNRTEAPVCYNPHLSLLPPSSHLTPSLFLLCP